MATKGRANQAMRTAKRGGHKLKVSLVENKNQGMRYVNQKSGELEQMAMREYDLLKDEMNKAQMRIENYIKKNPAKASLITGGIGVAIGTAMSLLLKGGTVQKAKRVISQKTNRRPSRSKNR